MVWDIQKFHNESTRMDILRITIFIILERFEFLNFFFNFFNSRNISDIHVKRSTQLN